MRDWIADRLAHRPVASGLVLALLVEAVSAFNRFALGLSTRDYLHVLNRVTFGVRVHHGYAGIACLAAWALAAAAGRGDGSAWRGALLAVGIGLALSDLVHHLAVLWPITGDAEFP